MSEKPYKSANHMDEELAELTDRILAGKSVEEADVEELRSLQETVSRLKSMADNPPPAGAMQRIEKQLTAEWHKNRALPDEGSSYWQKLIQFSKSLSSQPARGLVFAVVFIVLILIFITPLSQLISPEIQATAGGANAYQLLLFVGALIVVLGLFWYGRRKP